MSLSIDGVWKAGVWAETVWAEGVWREGGFVIDEPLSDFKVALTTKNIESNLTTQVITSILTTKG